LPQTTSHPPISTLSLHDALPIFPRQVSADRIPFRRSALIEVRNVLRADLIVWLKKGSSLLRKNLIPTFVKKAGPEKEAGFKTRQVGLEPTTSRLTAGCSTIELLPKNGRGRSRRPRTVNLIHAPME